MKRNFFWLLLIPLVLACDLLTGDPEPTPAPVDTPVMVSPSAMPPTEEGTAATPTAVPTAVPETGETPPPTTEPETTNPAVLPAALYYLNTDGQIMRLAADGLSLTQITNEPEPVTGFDVSPETNRLVYISGNSLIESDLNGDGRFVKIAGEAYDPDVPGESITKGITNPRYSPDGSQISFGLNGVNIIPSGASTEYEVIVPSDPYPDISQTPPDSEEPIRFFTSGAWSPDGTKLLVEFNYYPEAGGMAIKNLPDGALIDLDNPDFNITCCEWAWSADSSTGFAASNLLAYGAPGLVRFDTTTGEGTTIIDGLGESDVERSSENPIRLFKSVFPEGDGSLLSFVYAAVSNQEATSLPVYTMYRISPDGSSMTALRSDSHPIWEALWAEDGRGAVIVDNEYSPRYPPTGPMRWLPADGGPALNLPANGSHARWGSAATMSPTADSPTEADFASLKSQAQADFELEFLEDSINDLHYGRFNLGDGRSLWFIHTVGFRDFESQHHAVGVYAFEGGGWQRLATYTLPGFDETEGIPGPDYMNAGSVQQVFVEPANGWLTVEGGIGAHGGTLHLLRFDGQSLILEAENSNGSPVAGRVEDINGDGRQEALLNLTDYYIFSYAAGVRLINYDILHWDGSDMVPVTLTRVDLSENGGDLNNQAINLTEAALWKDARMVIQNALAQAPENETIRWNAAIITTIADARENANSSFPLMDRLFFGDYEAIIDMMRGYAPEELFTRESPLIVGTSAEASVDIMAEWIQTFTNSALTLRPDMASAHFLRGWAAYLLSPDDPAALADVERAAELAPDEPLFAAAADYLATVRE